MVVEIFTDGSCRPNPGPGGWAAILRYGGREMELSGGEADTTNNRMEMMAAIMALQALKRSCSVRIYSDSEIMVGGMNKPARRIKRAAIGKLPNADLWSQLDQVAAPHLVEWIWVRGHAGHRENERCDKLASKARCGLEAVL